MDVIDDGLIITEYIETESGRSLVSIVIDSCKQFSLIPLKIYIIRIFNMIQGKHKIALYTSEGVTGRPKHFHVFACNSFCFVFVIQSTKKESIITLNEYNSFDYFWL